MRQKTVLKHSLQSVRGLWQTASGITKCDRGLLQTASGITKCYKGLLQTASGITKCDRGLLQTASGIIKCDRGLLQTASGITKYDRSILQTASGITKCHRLLQSASGITKCDHYYKKRGNTFDYLWFKNIWVLETICPICQDKINTSWIFQVFKTGKLFNKIFLRLCTKLRNNGIWSFSIKIS